MQAIQPLTPKLSRGLTNRTKISFLNLISTSLVFNTANIMTSRSIFCKKKKFIKQTGFISNFLIILEIHKSFFTIGGQKTKSFLWMFFTLESNFYFIIKTTLKWYIIFHVLGKNIQLLIQQCILRKNPEYCLKNSNSVLKKPLLFKFYLNEVL